MAFVKGFLLTYIFASNKILRNSSKNKSANKKKAKREEKN